jgi:hypothetical protein
MNAAACLTLAAIHLLVWCKQRENWVYLAFSFCAVAGAGLTAFEFALLHAQTAEPMRECLEWGGDPCASSSGGSHARCGGTARGCFYPQRFRCFIATQTVRKAEELLEFFV